MYSIGRSSVYLGVGPAFLLFCSPGASKKDESYHAHGTAL